MNFWDKKYRQMKAELKEANEVIKARDENVESLRRHKAELQERLMFATMPGKINLPRNVRYQMEIDLLNHKIVKLQKALDGFPDNWVLVMDDNAVLQRNNADLKRDLDELQQHYGECHAALEMVRASATEQIERAQMAEMNNEERREEIRQLRGCIKLLKGDVNEYTEKLRLVVESRERFMELSDKLNEDLVIAKRQIEELKLDKGIYTTERIKELLQHNGNQGDTIHQLQKDNEHLKFVCKEKDGQIQNQAEQIHQLKKRFVRYKKNCRECGEGQREALANCEQAPVYGESILKPALFYWQKNERLQKENAKLQEDIARCLANGVIQDDEILQLKKERVTLQDMLAKNNPLYAHSNMVIARLKLDLIEAGKRVCELKTHNAEQATLSNVTIIEQHHAIKLLRVENDKLKTDYELLSQNVHDVNSLRNEISILEKERDISDRVCVEHEKKLKSRNGILNENRDLLNKALRFEHHTMSIATRFATSRIYELEKHIAKVNCNVTHARDIVFGVEQSIGSTITGMGGAYGTDWRTRLRNAIDLMDMKYDVPKCDGDENWRRRFAFERAEHDKTKAKYENDELHKWSGLTSRQWYERWHNDRMEVCNMRERIAELELDYFGHRARSEAFEKSCTAIVDFYQRSGERNDPRTVQGAIVLNTIESCQSFLNAAHNESVKKWNAKAKEPSLPLG